MKKRLSWRKRVVFAGLAVGLSLVIVAVVGEVVARVCTGDWSLKHELSGWLLVTDNEDAPTCHDPITGWALRANSQYFFERGACTYSIDGDGLRSNGQERPSGASILAVGDSFTFGCDVNDSDTWPAQLEGIVQTPVLNGGVIGFGIDQAVLRAELLVDRYKPDLLLFAFIDDDISRCEFAARQALKPWFTAKDGVLKLRGSPVPNVSSFTQIGPLRWTLGYSRLASLTAEFSPTFRERWYIGEYFRQVHEDGMLVSRLLIRRLAALQDRTRIIVVWLPTAESTRRGFTLLEESRNTNIEAIDGSNLEGVTYAVGGHYDALGNLLVARWIARSIATE